MSNNIEWTQAQINWRFGEGEIIDKKTYWVFKWFESDIEYTVYWSSNDARKAHAFLSVASGILEKN